MASLIAWGAGNLDTWLAAPAIDRAARLAFWIAAGIMVYGAVLFLAGMRPAHLKLKHETSM
jgi:putative peptidoglycan lipid II flippase